MPSGVKWGMSNRLDVIVVGGGLAGLAAGATAQQRGARVVVLDAHQTGGRARTVEREGFTLNMGAHALYAAGAGMRVLRSLGVPPTGAAPPLARYRALSGGSLHLLPTGPASILRTGVLSGRSKAQLVRVFAGLRSLRPHDLDRVSLDEWLADRHLRPDAEAVVRALVRLSTYSDDTAEFSAGAVVAQLQTASGGGVLYLHGGWTPLIDSLSAPLAVRTGVEAVGVHALGDGVEVVTTNGTMAAHRVVVAAGGPAAVRRLLPEDPGWGDLGPPVTAACLDLGLSRVPEPGYLLALDAPLYATVQSPPARQAPAGAAVMAAIRYGARSAAEDRASLEGLVAAAGVLPDDVVTRRFLAAMTVSGTLPRAASGGTAGRPAVTSTGVPGVVMAGDWVGPEGLLGDATLASGFAAGLLASQSGSNSSMMVV